MLKIEKIGISTCARCGRHLDCRDDQPCYCGLKPTTGQEGLREGAAHQKRNTCPPCRKDCTEEGTEIRCRLNQ